jgi:type I restriction-modification system DNA methylase subunit
MPSPKIQRIQDLLCELEKQAGLDACKEVVKAVVGLLVSDAENLKFRQFADQGGKLASNASWFQKDSVITDRLATYILDVPPETNLDIKLYGVNAASMRTIAWSVGLTENFEDEPFNGKFNVGIDFIIPKSLDRVIVALSKNYIVRTIELKGNLTVTFQEILSSWLKISDFTRKAELHSILWNSFDLQPINKRFYEGISQRFIQLRQHLESNEIHDSHHANQFANRLIGRVIFTWFLDKKSLINTESRYFQSSDFEDDSVYYRERLEPLFFEVLNMPIAERQVEDLFTPYLNGGLFESKHEDLYKLDRLTFPKDYFDDLFEFLRAYNFTTDESTSEFQQVAIDPEMLGRIFENLLAEVSEETGAQARKAKGAFYTPREIVDYMCREALKGYLKGRIAQDENLDRRLYQLIDASEREFHDQDHNWRRDLKPYKEEIVAALDELTVIDPACGSGAFPIGMLQLLVKVYSRIEPRFDSQKTKLSIVNRNIFGVDIEPMAVEISKLRTWLALVVDENQSQPQVKPLPNLDFKFVCANSLVNLDDSDSLSIFEDLELEARLQDLRDKYFRTQNLEKKKELRLTYQGLVQEELTLFGGTKKTNQLKSFQPFESDKVATFFDAKQMFGVDNFQIVLANPPYIGEKGNKETFRAVKESSLGRRFAQGKMDYFYYFFHLAIELAAEGGVICFITTNYFPKAPSAKALRTELTARTNILKLINFHELKIFKSAVGQHNMITLLSKTPPDPSRFVETCITERQGDADSSILQGILSWTDPETEYFSIRQSELFKGARLDIVLKAGTGLDTVLDAIESSGVPLGALTSITNGLHTGADIAFTFDEIPELLSESTIIDAFIRPLHKNSDIQRFGLRQTKKKVLYLPPGLVIEHYPRLKEYLLGFYDKLSSRAQIVRSGQPWHKLLWPREPGLFQEGPKIVAPYSSRENRFFFTEEQFYGSGDTYLILSQNQVDLRLICAYLNSSIGYVWFRNRGKLKGDMIFLQGDSLGVFPVAKAAFDGDERLQTIVDQIQALVGSSNVADEIRIDAKYLELYSELDRIVFEHYRLGDEEVALILGEIKNVTQ